MRPTTALAVALLLVLTAAASPRAGGIQGGVVRPDTVGASTKVDALFATWDHASSPGCAVGVIQDGRFIFRHGYGMADLEEGTRITTHTAFEVGSIAKQFTGMAVLLLEHEGLLSLDDDVRKYVPELPVYDPERPILLRDLLHHRSGLRDLSGLPFYAGVREGGEADFLSQDDVFDLVMRQRGLTSRPGDTFTYSNTGYWLLAMVVERVSGRSLRDFSRERIFAPLGMNDTRIYDDLGEIVPSRARGYTSVGNRLERTSNRVIAVGSSRLMTTVEDLLEWDGNFYEPRVGGRAVVQKMVEPDPATTSGARYAAGVYVSTGWHGIRRIVHNGATSGFRAEYVRFPDRRLSVAVLCNAEDIPASDLAHSVAEIYLGLAADGPARTTPSAPQSAPAEGASVPESALGTYTAQQGDSYFQLAPAAGSTVVILERVDTLPLHPLADGRYRIGTRGVALRLPTTGGADAQLESLGGGGTARAFAKVPAADASTRRGHAGAYFSEDLDVTYWLVDDGEGLVIHLGAPKGRTLDPAPLLELDGERVVMGDGYSVLRFSAQGKRVKGFMLETRREIKLPFVRR